MAVETASVIMTLLVVGHVTSGQAAETSEGNSGKDIYACARNFLADLYAYCGSEHTVERRGGSDHMFWGIDRRGVGGQSGGAKFWGLERRSAPETANRFWRERRVYGGNLNRFWREKASEPQHGTRFSHASVALETKLTSCLANLVKEEGKMQNQESARLDSHVTFQSASNHRDIPEDIEFALAEIFSDPGSELSMVARICCEGRCPGYIVSTLNQE